MRINRGLLFWGLALVVGGAVALAVQFDYLDRTAVADSWRLWPVILIAIGLAIILSRTDFAVVGTVVAALVIGYAGGAVLSVGPRVFTCGGADPTSLETDTGIFTGSDATVGLDFNCGTLIVDLAPGSDWTARTGATGGRKATVSATGDALTISSPNDSFGFTEGRQRWEVALGSDPTYDLEVSPNAAETHLNLATGSFDRLSISPNAGSVVADLSGASVASLDASLNAGALSLTLDAASDVTGSLSANAGSIEVCTAEGTAVRFTVDANLTFSHNLDSSGLSRSGDTWTSPGFASAAHTVDITLEGNAASFTLNPEGGCS